MQRNGKILQWLLYAGALYFTAIALAHSIGFKVPLLFIYYDVPSLAYQDGIIAFMSLGWAAFFYSCAGRPMEHRPQVRALLAACTMALFGLAGINLFGGIHRVVPDVDTTTYWLQWGLLAVYVVALYVSYFRLPR